MKKILLFVLFYTFLLTTLIVTVSAADYNFGEVSAPITTIEQKHIFGDEDHGSGLHRDGWYNSKYENKANNTGFARVMLRYTKDGATSTVTYPAYYVLANDSTLNWHFKDVSDFLGVELNVGNVVAIEIPYGITVIPKQAFVLPGAFNDTITDEHPMGHVEVANTTLEYVFCSNTVLTIGDFAFAHCSNLSVFDSNRSASGATGDHNHQMVEYIGHRAFHECGKLTDFNFNNHLAFLGEGCFEGCALTNIDLSKCVELTVIPKNCFHESNAGTVTAIILSSSIEEICDNAFTGASAEHLFLGTNVKKIGHNAISMSDAEYIILPVTIETVYGDSIDFGNNSYSPIIVGAKSQEEVEKVFSLFLSVGISLKQINNPGKVYSDSVAFFADTNPSFCETYLHGHTINHDSTTITSVSYPKGIEHEGIAYGSCGVCNQALTNTPVKLTPIIVAKGYSVCMYNGYYAFSDGFEVYHDALNVYERVYGDVEIGLLFLLEEKYNSSFDLRNDISQMGLLFNQDAYLDKDQNTFSSLEYVLTYSKGLQYDITDAEGNKVAVNRGDASVIVSAYLYHKDENKSGNLYDTSFYVQDTDDICIKGATQDGKYVTVSYNSIYGTVSHPDEEIH